MTRAAVALPVFADRAPAALRTQRWPWASALFVTLCFLLATGDPLAPKMWESAHGTDLSEMVANVAQGQWQRQVGFLALGAWGAALLALWPGRLALRVDPLLAGGLALRFGVSFASIVWAAERGLVAKRLVLLACMLTAAVALARRFTFRQVVFCLLVGNAVIQLVGVANEARLGTFLGYDGWRLGGFYHANLAGMSASLMALCGLYFYASTKRAAFLAFVVAGAALLMLTKSRTALLALLVGGGVFAALALRPRQAFGLAVAGVTTVALVGALAVAGVLGPVWEAALMSRDDSQVTTLTGRTDIWAAAWSILAGDAARPLVGAGYEGFWTDAVTKAVSARVGYTISESHNAYFDLLLEVGVVGVLAHLAVLAGAARLALAHYRATRSLQAALLLALVAVTAVHGLTESMLVDPHHPSFFLLALFAGAALCAPRETRA